MKNIAVIGASGAIGSAFIKILAENNDTKKIYAFARSKINISNSKVIYHPIDVTDENNIEAACAEISEPIDTLIIACGKLHGDNLHPEKALKDLNFKSFDEIFKINTFGPAIVIKHFSQKLVKHERCIIAALSARVGSIADNHLGGWYAYRASKAALNMVLKTASIELQRLNKKTIVAGLHPGTVDSSLSKPFQASVPKDKLFSPEHAASQLLEVIQSLTPEQSGFCFDYAHKKIEY